MEPISYIPYLLVALLIPENLQIPSAIIAPFMLTLRLLLTGGFSWRSALENELNSCSSAYDQLMTYKEHKYLQGVLHSVLKWIGINDLVRYQEPSISDCYGPMRTLLTEFLPRCCFNIRSDAEATLRLIDEITYWPQRTLLICSIILSLLMIL